MPGHRQVAKVNGGNNHPANHPAPARGNGGNRPSASNHRVIAPVDGGNHRSNRVGGRVFVQQNPSPSHNHHHHHHHHHRNHHHHSNGFYGGFLGGLFASNTINHPQQYYDSGSYHGSYRDDCDASFTCKFIGGVAVVAGLGLIIFGIYSKIYPTNIPYTPFIVAGSITGGVGTILFTAGMLSSKKREGHNANNPEDQASPATIHHPPAATGDDNGAFQSLPVEPRAEDAGDGQNLGNDSGFVPINTGGPSSPMPLSETPTGYQL